MASAPTRERLLDAGEQLYAERGFAETSLRELTAAAGVNLAAVHYHFGSKQALLRAVFERRIAPVNASRLARLEKLAGPVGDAERAGQAGPAGQPEHQPASPVEVEALLQAFLAPALELLAAREGGSRHFLRLVGRLLAEPARHHAEWLREVFAEVEAAFVPAFQSALPQLPPDTLLWRLHFVVGVQCIVMMNPERLAAMSDDRCRTDDPAEVLAQIVSFAAAGLRAPAPPAVEPAAAPPRPAARDTR